MPCGIPGGGAPPPPPPSIAATLVPGAPTGWLMSHASLEPSSDESCLHAKSEPSLHISPMSISSCPHSGISAVIWGKQRGRAAKVGDAAFAGSGAVCTEPRGAGPARKVKPGQTKSMESAMLGSTGLATSPPTNES